MAEACLRPAPLRSHDPGRKSRLASGCSERRKAVNGIQADRCTPPPSTTGCGTGRWATQSLHHEVRSGRERPEWGWRREREGGRKTDAEREKRRRLRTPPIEEAQSSGARRMAKNSRNWMETNTQDDLCAPHHAHSANTTSPPLLEATQTIAKCIGGRRGWRPCAGGGFGTQLSRAARRGPDTRVAVARPGGTPEAVGTAWALAPHLPILHGW